MPAIGDPFLGGVLAYILQPGDPGYDANVPHGLIAAPSDQSTGVIWGCYGNLVTGADGSAIGTGRQNTEDIVIGCFYPTPLAADVCDILSLGGYDDWYLPSIDELLMLRNNKTAIGGFSNANYWSSTQQGTLYAQFADFSGSAAGGISKNSSFRVRAIRDF